MSPGTAPAGLVVETLDPFDDAAFERWYAVRAASQRHGREATASFWTLPELKVQVQAADPRTTRQLVSASLDGEVVAAGFVAASLVDNLTAAEVGVDVRPDRRGRGIGSALLADLERRAADLGRTVLQAEVSWPHDADPLGAGVDAVELARSHGYEVALVDVQRDLALPVDPDLLTALAAEAAPHHAAYRLEVWSGPVPERLVESWAALVATLDTEAPTGEMEREVEALDVAGVRADEARLVAQGRTKWNVVALDADGAVVGYTDAVTTVHEPGLVYQWGTLVHRDHRGHRLGLALKVANLQQLARERPDLRVVRTWNAEVNAPMVGVNERLGFVPTERLGELQKHVG